MSGFAVIYEDPEYDQQFDELTDEIELALAKELEDEQPTR
jgi:hypothetical protein